MALFQSLRTRLTLWYVLLLAITLAAFCGGVYIAMRQNLYANLDDSLEGRTELVSGILTEEGVFDTDVMIQGDPTEGEEFVRVYDENGDLALDNSGPQFRPATDPNAVEAALSGETARRDIQVDGVELRVMTSPVMVRGETVGAVEVALSKEEVRDTLNQLLVIIAVAYPIALVVAGLGGAFLAGRALAPIDRVARVARRISAEDLSQRLDMHLPDDEVGRLANTFDEMIARLDEAFRRQRQFTADASHELRTPLTAIKGQTEVALQRDRDADTYREVLRKVNGEVDRMIRLVGSLLTLARADARQIPVGRESLDLGALVTDAVEQVRPAASEKAITLNVRSNSTVQLRADQDLILQLMLNLLDNSVKYTPNGGAIDVSLRAAGAQAEVSVADTGPGIASEHLPHIFDRFYRVDKARTRAEGGAGLGLSISRWIAEAHGGTLQAESTPGRGSKFTLSLPFNDSSRVGV
jgi:heavy metal sensor kinase